MSKIFLLIKSFFMFMFKQLESKRYQYGYRYKYKKYYRHEHYQAYNILAHIGDFQKIQDDISSPLVKEIRTLCKISPLDVNFLTTMHDVSKHKGKPRFTLHYERPLFSHDAYFYKDRIDSLNLLTQFHFYDSKLWLIKQEISYVDQKDCDKVLDLLFAKYAIEDWRMKFLNKNIRIVDSLGSSILINTSFKIEILYSRVSEDLTGKLNTVIDKLIRNSARNKKIIELKLLQNL